MIGIYKITSPSGKVYIGQSWDIKIRWRDYKAGWNTTQRWLTYSFRKYTKEAHVFEVCMELPIDISQKIMDNMEQAYIEIYRDTGFKLMNLREGGSKGRHSEETKKILSERGKGKTAWNKGLKGCYKKSEKSKQLMRDIMTGKPKPWQVGRKMLDNTRKGLEASNYGWNKRKGLC